MGDTMSSQPAEENEMRQYESEIRARLFDVTDTAGDAAPAVRREAFRVAMARASRSFLPAEFKVSI